jgi:hypothetical protein
MAPAATGPYSITTSVPQKLQKISESVAKNSNSNEAQEKDENTIYKIVVSTKPAELIQSVGEAKFTPVENSGLLFVSNSGDDIFMDVNTQDYYVLISGRWFRSKSLSGNWSYTGSDQLPDDFAKIPEGSAKDRVLASIAGTDAANDAIEEAAVPQTAKVDRNSAQAEVVYDGDPRFEDIDGTDLGYAINTPASVIRWRGRYYSVDNGVWFESGRATGPWVVSVSRPYAVALIPPRYPVYHMKYVYIYDVTPDYVYMGYTPGYLNNFVYGPTVVYGTGFYYRPWFGTHYYARPYTWGFNVRYDPWIGWGLGYRYSAGWFNVGIGIGRPWGAWGGGWWGPRSYRPAYCYSPFGYRGGYYGRGNVYYNRGRNYNVINRNYSANVYRNRGGIVSRDYQRTTFNNRYRDNRGPNNAPRYNNRNAYNNRNNVGSRPSNNNNRPVREYNPNGRNDPYNRNNRINGERNENNRRDVTPDNRTRPGNNRYNNSNRDPYNNRNVNPDRGNSNGRPNGTIRPNNTTPENQTTMPGRISRPDRGERINRTPAEQRVTPTGPVQNQRSPERRIQNRPQSEATPQRQVQPRQERQIQQRPMQARPERQVQRRESSPTVRQREARPAQQGARSGGERASRGSDGRRPDRNN